MSNDGRSILKVHPNQGLSANTAVVLEGDHVESESTDNGLMEENTVSNFNQAIDVMGSNGQKSTVEQEIIMASPLQATDAAVLNSPCCILND